jgi:polar amino acid transport system substrate-binding protein
MVGAMTASNERNITRKEFVKGAGSALGMAFAMGLAGCSSGGGSSSASSSSASSSDSAAAADSSASGASEYILVTEGKLTGVSDMAYPPLESIPDGSTTPEGFEIDMMDALAKKLGLEMTWLSPTKFDTIIPMIKQGGKADVGVSAFTITDERKEEIDFTESYLDSNQGLVTQKSATDKTQEALDKSGKKIAVQSGTTGEDWVKENLPNATCVPLDDAIQAMTGVQSGLYNACVIDLPVASYMCTKSYTDLTVAISIATGEQYGIVVSKKNTKLTKDLNAAIEEMKSDGSLDELEKKWFGTTI